MTDYTFSETDLHSLKRIWDLDPEFGPRAAYRWWHNMKNIEGVPGDIVDKFCMAFRNQYQTTFGKDPGYYKETD